MTDFVVIQSGNQVEPQPKSAAAIAIAFRDDAKDFQMTNHVLHQHPLPRQLPVGAQLLLAQRFAFRLLERCLRVSVCLLQALITGIAKYANVFGNLKPGLFEHRKIVRFPISPSSANDPASRPVNDNLRFYRVPLSPTRIISALFFFGRSIGVSARVHDDKLEGVFAFTQYFFAGQF